jgi:hypothetical protein
MSLAIVFLPYRLMRLLIWVISFLLRLFQMQGFKIGHGSYSIGPQERWYGSRRLWPPPPPHSGFLIFKEDLARTARVAAQYHRP